MFGLSKLQLCIAGGLGLALLCATTWALFERSGRLSLEVDAEKWRSAIQQHSTAAKSAEEALGKCLAANEQFAKLKPSLDQLMKLSQDLLAANDELARQNAALDRAARETDDANPDCQKFMALDFERGCPNYAHGLRVRAARDGHQGGDGGGQGPGPHRDPR